MKINFSKANTLKFTTIILLGLAVLIIDSPNNELGEYYKQKIEEFKSDKAEVNIVMIGDSITEFGLWDKRFPDLNIINHGISGDIAYGILQRMHISKELKPKKIFIMIGINDLGRGHEVHYIFINYKKIISYLAEDGAEIYIQSTLMCNDDWDKCKGVTPKIIDLDNRLEAFAKEFNYHYIDLNQLLAANDKLLKEYSIDGLHLNEKGYEVWTKKLLEKIAIKE